MYAVHLSNGYSIHCKQLKVATIEQYLLAASSFITLFTGIDYRKDNPSDKTHGHILAPVLRDLRKYESVPNRREPYDPTMHAQAKLEAAVAPQDSLTAALVDLIEQGYNAGYRLSECAQPTGMRNPASPQLNDHVAARIRTRAIVPVDLRAVTTDNRRVSGLDILLYPLDKIERMWVVFRTQKNGQHGEEKLFVRNPDPNGSCYLSSAYRALARFKRLMAKDLRLDPATTPLSIYYDTQLSAVRLIDAKDIAVFIQRMATLVYHLDPVRDALAIRKWGCHSLRVGAAVTLHAMGFSTLDIQWILRWRSTAFMVYLRNVAIMSTRQNAAWDRAAALPFL
jgi:hypothetical protein